MSHEIYARVFTTAYALLATSALVVGASAPFLAVLLFTPVTASWPLLVLTAPSVGPAFAAAHAVFGSVARDDGAPVVRGFLRAWRRHGRRAAIVAGAASAVLAVLAVDVRAAWGTPVGAVAIPVLVVLAVLTAVTALVALTGVVEHPDVPLRRLVRACLFLGLRRAHFTAVSLVVLWVLAAAVGAMPVPALALLTGPALYVVWVGSRATLRPLRVVPGSEPDPRSVAAR
ncbi:hypothetical protein ADK67_18865 [Saccharothrix sp. NRRL B-16348]|uniref:DUF624 domain-containing protein n=1 Tax=Saccharothrix sp. NRRL B-16348 TaxID=1415542 RepID=UPI0006AEC26F|nr:DUF624 domain-containing protein [Saccharothrix sp. NRRL B-16348]KOX24375.1 hypothetical protein ADK67_18865 [Saccharothrix sp. NRRL B-16348]